MAFGNPQGLTYGTDRACTPQSIFGFPQSPATRMSKHRKNTARKSMLRRWLVRGLALSGVLVVTVVCYLLANTWFESTPGGVHERIVIKLGESQGVAIPAYGGTGDAVHLAGFLDGPVVQLRPDASWKASWFCQDTAHVLEGSGDALSLECAGRKHVFALQNLPVPPARAAMPSRLVVLSDLEGNHDFAIAALTHLGVTNAQGAWSFGDGHLVVLGDSVDRGRDVFALLWMLHDLARQADAAGGAVHVMVGNHEQYVLRGNISRAHPEHRYGMQQMGGYQAALGRGTVLGDWLRQQPVVLMLGNTLFAHGGISPYVVAGGLDLETLNRVHRQYWQQPASEREPSAELEAVFGPEGVTQYRGLLMANEGKYGLASTQDVEAALAHFQASQLVVGHTQVPGVQRIHGELVWAVNVNSDDARPEVLVFEAGQPRVVDIGIGRQLATAEPNLRGFDITRRQDWQALWRTRGEISELSKLPHPY